MFAGKRYWIVGASEGLGRALAQALDAAGAHVVISARNADRLADLAATLTNAQVLAVDVTDTTSVAATTAQLPALDGMIYCVGLYDPMRAQGWKLASALAMAEANFTGALRVLDRVLPNFVARDAGHLVLIGSLAGFRGLPGAIGYGASKAALMHLAENLHADLRKTGVKVQLCNPGFIRTRLTAKNDFAMPFIQTPEVAATYVMRAMQGNRFETSFPRPFSWLFLAARLMPNWAYFRIFG
jgi:short-subunit dehydrogenase